MSTLPFAIDDLSQKPCKEIDDVIYNRAPMRRGSAVPISVPIVATNFSLCHGERFVMIMTIML